MLADSQQKPFIEHLRELRYRLGWSVGAAAAGAVVGYQFNAQLTDILLQPYGQKLFYSSLMGGLDFLIRICLFFGILLAVPVATYHILRFIEPIMPRRSRLAMIKLMSASVGLALAGVLFAYFLSLPAAILFLSGFNTTHLQPLISADQYFNFVMIHLAGFAAIFQLPLVLLFINRITPLNPGGLMKQQRLVIAVSFILAAILTPTPDIVNMAIMALPMILLYQVALVLIWLTNRRPGPTLATNPVVSRPARVKPEPVKAPIKPSDSGRSARPRARSNMPAVLDLRPPSNRS